MDIVTNYHGFRQDVKDCFEGLIQEFNLKLVEPSEGYFLLLGKNCIIRINFDRGDISCQFKQTSEPLDSPGYSVWSVYNFIWPVKEDAEKTTVTYDSKQQLVESSNIVSKLKNVLNGDFSWLNDFLKKQEKENKIFRFVFFDLDYNNPISQKLSAGDLSWRQDIEHYLNENNINL